MKTNITKEEIHSLTRLGRLEYELGRYTKEQLEAPFNRLSDNDSESVDKIANEAGYDEADDYADEFDLWESSLENVIRSLVIACYTLDSVVYSDRDTYVNATENSIRKTIQARFV